MRRIRCGWIGLSASLLACGGSAKPPPVGDGGPPAVLTITAPVSGATVVVGPDADKSVPVSFTVQNLAVAAQGQCNGTATCGHVEVFIDGAACSGVQRDNAEGGSSPVKAKLAKCTPPTGMHTIRLELHYDDYTPVLDASNQPVGAEITVTVLAPSISITSPATGTTVTPGTDHDQSLPVGFTTQEFTLTTPGSCPAASQGSCGSVFLLIDGKACDDTTGGDQGFNDLLTASPGNAKFVWCHTLHGNHTLSLELHNDDKTPLKNVSGATMAASVSVTVP
jgi:hypothetical protein